MTDAEARTVLNIIMTADDDCVYCARKLVKSFIYSFPQFETVAQEEFKFTFETSL